MEITEAFGVALKNLRELRCLSQEKLAHTSGLHRTYISLLERGEKSPSIETVNKLSKALDVSMSQFFLLTEDVINIGHPDLKRLE